MSDTLTSATLESSTVMNEADDSSAATGKQLNPGAERQASGEEDGKFQGSDAVVSNEFTTVDLDESAAASVGGIPLGNPQVLQRDVVPMSKRLSDIKTWGVTHIKCTRQIISEKFGKGSRTVDVQLDERIQSLRETQRKYQQILVHSRKLTLQLRTNTEVQRNLGDMFAEYAVRSPELLDEFKSNSTVQRQVARNGELLLALLDSFCGNVQTLVSKTMDDTLLNVKGYEAARVEYDAFRSDLENLRAALVQNPANASKKAKLEEAEKELESHRVKYDQLRSDLSVKLRFLDENRVKVMQKQLVLLHNATCAYYTGNAKQLDECVQIFHVKLPPREGQVTSPTAEKLPTAFELLPMSNPSSPERGESSVKTEGESAPRY